MLDDPSIIFFCLRCSTKKNLLISTCYHLFCKFCITKNYYCEYCESSCKFINLEDNKMLMNFDVFEFQRLMLVEKIRRLERVNKRYKGLLMRCKRELRVRKGLRENNFKYNNSKFENYKFDNFKFDNYKDKNNYMESEDSYFSKSKKKSSQSFNLNNQNYRLPRKHLNFTTRSNKNEFLTKSTKSEHLKKMASFKRESVSEFGERISMGIRGFRKR